VEHGRTSDLWARLTCQSTLGTEKSSGPVNSQAEISLPAVATDRRSYVVATTLHCSSSTLQSYSGIGRLFLPFLACKVNHLSAQNGVLPLEGGPLKPAKDLSAAVPASQGQVLYQVQGEPGYGENTVIF
jgi:hypothetical protein